jgi:ParB family chromosome partitioning protein
MARKKRPRVNLSQPIRPQSGDLEKLFTTADDVEQASGLQLLAIRIDAIQPDTDQPRRTFPEESLQELRDSILQDGVIQPIEVTQIGPDRYLIVHGERRWRAAHLAGLETIPAIVRRRDYDEITRFVRQLVENIQREDLNDVDRAAGLLRLRDLMQEELLAATTEEVPSDQPWARKITWAKIGKRLGYSRQRIHQLIQLLKLPDEIKDDVRSGSLTERDTRIYQGLKYAHQRALHRARMSGELSQAETRRVARYLKATPQQSVPDAVNILKQPPPPAIEQPFDSSFEEGVGQESPPGSAQRPADSSPKSLRSTAAWGDGSIIPPRTGGPTSIDRLDWVRGHLARVQRQGITAAERREMLRLLQLVQQDVTSLIAALDSIDDHH